MTWSYTTTPVLDEIVLVDFGSGVQQGLKQVANDLYIAPVNDEDGVGNLTYPLQQLAPIFSSYVSSNGTSGTLVTLPASYVPTLATDYIVQLTYQGDPGANGAIWAEKGTANFTIKNYGTKVVVIAYTILRKTA